MTVHERPTSWERRGLWVLGLLILLFGAMTTQRAAFRTTTRGGDTGIYFRAGWAARMGGERLYRITCDKGLHFHYPPIAACLFVPFADPPAGAEHRLVLPYAASVALWYLCSVGLLLAGLHLLANTLETAAPSPCGSRRWWSLRVLPLLACLGCVGSTLVKGQVTPLLFFLICAALSAAARGWRLTAGMALAAAVCVKIFPAFLLAAPLWRREGRTVFGFVVGLTLGLVVLPTLAFGPSRALECYRQLEAVVIGPALGWKEDQSRGAELIDTTGTWSQSLVSAITSIEYPDREVRPPKASALARSLHWGLAACLTLATLWAFRRPVRPLAPHDEARRSTLFVGTLILVMLLACPVCHLHYLMLAIPLVMALIALDRDRWVYPGPRLWLLLGVHAATIALAQLPALVWLKDKCLPSYGVLLLWGVGCWVGNRSRQQARPVLRAMAHRNRPELAMKRAA